MLDHSLSAPWAAPVVDGRPVSGVGEPSPGLLVPGFQGGVQPWVYAAGVELVDLRAIARGVGT
jgi:hypothetical protein